MNKVSETTGRLHYIDWLRVLAMVGIFFFHNARLFDEFDDWHVKNATTNLGASIFVAFMGQWIMPLFFLIAGTGTYYALRSRRALKFIQERSLRLLIPLIFGMLIIIPPQIYYEAISHGQSGTTIIQTYVQNIKTLPDLNWYHLWFLAYLFVFSIITLPIFLTRSERGKSIISHIAKALDKPWALLLLLVLSLTAIGAFINPAGFWGNKDSGGWNIIAYLLFFIYGYLIFANIRIMETIKKFGWITLVIAFILTACLVVFFTDQIADPVTYFGTTKFVAAQFVQVLNTWFWLFAILALASRYLKSSNKFLVYANEAVLPFYMLHQTIIIVIGFYVVQWNTSVALKYLTISTTSFIAIMAIYELLVRRLNILSFLFGMKLRKTHIHQVRDSQG